MRINKTIFIFLLILFETSLFSQNADIRLLRSVNSSEVLPSDKFFRFISNSNAFIVVAAPVSMGTFGLINDDKELLKNTCTVASAIAVNEVITLALKYSFNHDRPFVTYPDITKKSDAGSPSFPSGHTSSAFATATSLSLVFKKWYVTVPSYAWAGTVGYSRMHLGVHYPSDVLAGALIGSGCAWLTYTVNKKLFKSRK
jgi:membrane-associated phospholipid phosphatase